MTEIIQPPLHTLPNGLPFRPRGEDVPSYFDEALSRGAGVPRQDQVGDMPAPTHSKVVAEQNQPADTDGGILTVQQVLDARPSRKPLNPPRPVPKDDTPGVTVLTGQESIEVQRELRPNDRKDYIDTEDPRLPFVDRDRSKNTEPLPAPSIGSVAVASTTQPAAKPSRRGAPTASHVDGLPRIGKHRPEVVGIRSHRRDTHRLLGILSLSRAPRKKD